LSGTDVVKRSEQRECSDSFGNNFRCAERWDLAPHPVRRRFRSRPRVECASLVQFDVESIGALEDLFLRLLDLSVRLFLDARDFVSRIPGRQDQLGAFNWSAKVSRFFQERTRHV